MASWHGTDLILARFKDINRIMGGYFSYQNGDKYSCIFYTKGPNPDVIAMVTFDSSYNTATADVNDISRPFTTIEKKLFTLRTLASEEIQKDTLFKSYENTNLNVIPMISGNEDRVYVLTGTSVPNVVILGNDYLIRFSKDGKLIEKSALHNNIIPIRSAEEEGKVVVGSMHNHQEETGSFITSTDICTLMLYGRFTKWKQHIVMSSNYVSVWYFGINSLAIMPRDQWEK
jgi:hypothetical protein